MRREGKALALFLGIGLFFMGNRLVFSEPGSDKDPLVTRSFVEKKISEVKSYVDSKLSKDYGDELPIGNIGASGLDVVELSKGQKIIGGQGTEIILRSGRAKVIGSDLGGLSDLTVGKDLKTGSKAEENHLLVVPRDDGRGIEAQGLVFCLVRGTYTVK